MKGCAHDPQTKINRHDRKEINLFKRFLENKERYGIEKMIKKKYWRKYLGLEKP